MSARPREGHLGASAHPARCRVARRSAGSACDRPTDARAAALTGRRGVRRHQSAVRFGRRAGLVPVDLTAREGVQRVSLYLISAAGFESGRRIWHACGVWWL